MAYQFIDTFMNFVKNNAFLIIGCLIVGFAFFWLLKKQKKKDLKPLARSETERKNFIERMKINKTSYKWLFRGGECVGKIKALMPSLFKEKRPKKEKKMIEGREIWVTIEEETGNKKYILEMVIKPIIDLFGLKIPNPFQKERCIMCNSETIEEMNKPLNYIRIDEKVTFDKVFGIYYDRRFEPEFIDYILVNCVFRTDWDSFASVYFSKAQEQATFDPERALTILQKQQELEIEKQKRAKMTDNG
jgi:hypothetical protein